MEVRELENPGNHSLIFLLLLFLSFEVIYFIIAALLHILHCLFSNSTFLFLYIQVPQLQNFYHLSTNHLQRSGAKYLPTSIYILLQGIWLKLNQMAMPGVTNVA